MPEKSNFDVESPLVTVVCLCFNHEHFVEEAILSVIQQTHRSIEVIVVDDASSDGSATVIERMIVQFSQIKLIRNVENLGITKSFNKAFAIANGQFVIDFATDDVLSPHAIERLLDVATKHDDCVVYGNSERINVKGQTIGNFFEVDHQSKAIQKIPSGFIYGSIVNSGEIVNPVAMLVSRGVHEDLGGYNDNLVYEDLDFWLRASRKFPFFYIDEILSKKRLVETSLGNEFRKRSKFSRQINLATFKTLWMAFTELNTSKSEHQALLKRVHYEIGVVIRNRNIKLWIPYLVFAFCIRFKILTSK